MNKLFELITDYDIAHCIRVWAHSVGKDNLIPDCANVQQINQLKVLLSKSDKLTQMTTEAQLAIENDDFSLNTTFIDKVFSLLDSKLLH